MGAALRTKKPASDSLTDVKSIRFVEGTSANRLRMTIEGHLALGSLCRKLKGKSPEERMWAARTLVEITDRDGHLNDYLREYGGSEAGTFREALGRAFSVGDKELNGVLKQLRKNVYTERKPRHCMVFSAEEIAAEMAGPDAKRSSEEGSS